ncbi:uncharacterized protein sS8_3591 [Methylocaldum marinum]|uniref:Uncharacterized protein n=1 Tax=Methylocaldum marinum TaxID=1432792 RepID=A0A250KV41_9GAMM|nr:hypothetical protein [Methylocaldum marinum]BBA35528.1 uncharacterized protein sS8_3591 [Methylocaldum marinum]
MIERLEDRPWSRYRAMVGEANAPDWLDADGMLSQFGRERKSAIEAYRRFVKDGQRAAQSSGSDPASRVVGR